MLRALCLVALGLLLVFCQATEADTGPDLSANAALKYWQAFATLPHMSDAEQNKLVSACLKMPLDDDARRLVAQANYSLKMMHRGAALAGCDWGIPVEDGIYARLPQGPAARALISIACLRARLQFEGGHKGEAINDISAALSLSRHLTQNSTLVLLLLGYRVEHVMNETLAHYLPKLTREELQNLKARLEKLPAGGNAAKSLLAEEKFGADWLVRTIKETKDKEALLAVLSPLFIIEGSDAKDRDAKVKGFFEASGGAEGILKLVEKVRPSYARIASKLDLPPAEFEKEFQREEKAQAENPVFGPLFSALPRVRMQQARADVRRALLAAAISVQLDGPDALKKIPDPINGEPFAHEAFAGGFELRSKLKGQDGQSLAIKVGQAGK
jgi:hypothetical protein